MPAGRVSVRGVTAALEGACFTAGRTTNVRTLHTTGRAAADKRRNEPTRQTPREQALKSSNVPNSSSSSSSSKQPEIRLFDEEKTEEGLAKHRTQYNVDPFSLKPASEHYDYPLVSSQWLSKQSVRPTRVRMLARDFIHDALYNPQYGYFSRHAVLLPDGDQRARSYDFPSLSNDRAFAVAVEERYRAFEEALNARDKVQHEANQRRVEAKMKEVLQPLMKTKAQQEVAAQQYADQESADAALEGQSSSGASRKRTRKVPALGTANALTAAQRKGRMDLARQLLNEQEVGEHDRDVKAMAARQVWHTPTELFKPHYAHAVARYMLDTRSEGEPLRVYEVGAGSGALASDILDYVQAEHPDVYASMTYHIIEISPRLADQQRKALARHVGPRLQISNTSVFDWQTVERSPCFFLAMEVFDNLTHDVVRYSTETLQPYQAIVSIDATGDMHELWEPALDKTITRYLDILRQHQSRQAARTPVTAPNWMRYAPDAVRRALVQGIPFYPNLTEPYYIPTGSLQLLDVLARYFPQHRLVMSDFNQLPDSVPGRNAPVVQTRLNGTMIPVTKYTVYQGFFDIFFPTNFTDLQRAHAHVVGTQGNSQILSHRAFLQRYADVPQTTCKDGSNPMLSWYANASWFLS